MTPRDPRMDPQPGDVIRHGRQDVAVIAVKGEKVYFSPADAKADGFSLIGYSIPLEMWREQAKDAEVVNG